MVPGEKFVGLLSRILVTFEYVTALLGTVEEPWPAMQFAEVANRPAATPASQTVVWAPFEMALPGGGSWVAM